MSTEPVSAAHSADDNSTARGIQLRAEVSAFVADPHADSDALPKLAELIRGVTELIRGVKLTVAAVTPGQGNAEDVSRPLLSKGDQQLEPKPVSLVSTRAATKAERKPSTTGDVGLSHRHKDWTYLLIFW